MAPRLAMGDFSRPRRGGARCCRKFGRGFASHQHDRFPQALDQ